MPLLTKENLDPNTFPYYDYNVFLRGRTYFTEGRVTILNFTGQTAACRVRDDQGNYTVSLSAETKTQVKTDCDCAQFARMRMCKHVLASVMAVRDYITREASNQWEYRLKMALESTPRRKAAASTRRKYAIFFALQREKLYNDEYSFRLFPFRISSQDWAEVRTLEGLIQQEKNERLEKDRSWAHAAESVISPLNFEDVVNAPMEGVYLYNMMQKLGGYSYGLAEFTSYLPMMAKIDLPVFLLGARNGFKERLILLSEPVKIEAALAFDGQNYSLQAGLNLNQETFTTIKGSLQVLSTNPAWALAGRYILPIQNPEALSFLNFFPLVIPARDEQDFREKYLHTIVERVPIKGDVVSWEDVEETPVPRLYLRDEEGVLRAALRFGYGRYEVEGNPKADALTLLDLPGAWGMARIHRQLEQENEYYQLLAQAKYGLKRASSPQPSGTFELRSKVHPLDFLLHSIPQLTQAGFEIFGEESLKTARINRSKPTISLNITSGVDWFDVNTIVRYGDQEVNFHEIRRALLKRERFIKLADGSIGQIPEEWLKRYKALFDLGEETADGLRVHDYHLPLVDTLLQDADEQHIAADYQQRKQALSSFESIQPQPVPQGFNGELRAYQKAGVDWLYFLYEYSFGGCLADDMGLGKTIQVLAYLQLMKEKGLLNGPSLLVVPKSLIANWMREAERFTPGLSMIEFVGNTRKKDLTVFANVDVVLTTYGTMLRDIEFLRACPFFYTILDESQNIKNPLSQSSKAARLLRAQHRLVMTGTPVENNTFELWSQFAFLNPGLLGNMEYFRREFATPIESHTDEDTSQLLKRLVYPFILRRTKEQVAPELPEQTERVLYTDLGPAQRKLYNHTRDYYRGLLMGMIDDEGMDQARMKILEGLLRLRQICIHPALVDSSYHGDSAKFELLLETLETLHSEGHKALIFSQFVQTLHLLQEELNARKIRYTYLDGQTNDRQKQVDIFQTDLSIPFFLISLKAGGVGLNLTAADYVIHIDPWWNPAVEMQAADRAHRIGQDKPVFVYKIIARDSVEEKILKLQEHKKELVDQLISAEGSFFKSITRDDVKTIFS